MEVDNGEPESSVGTNDVDANNAKEAPAAVSDSVDAADQKEATNDVVPAETEVTKAEEPTVVAEKAPAAVTESVASTPVVVDEPAPAVEPPTPAAEAEVKPTESEAPKVVQSEPVSAVEPVSTVAPNAKNGDIAPEADVKAVVGTPVEEKTVAENDLKPATDIENNESSKLNITSSKYYIPERTHSSYFSKERWLD